MKKLALMFVIFIPVILTASNQFDKSAYYNYGTKLYAETHFLPSNSKDSVNTVILFKIMNDIITFTQVNPLVNPGNFLSTPSVELSIKDENGIIRKRDIWRDSIYLKTFSETNSKTDYITGFFKLTMPLGVYEITLTLDDQFASNLDEVKNKFTEKFDFANKSTIGHPIFTIISNKNSEIFNPIILGGKVPFRSDDIETLIPISTKDVNDVYNFAVSKTKDDKNKIWNTPVNFSGRADAMFGKTLNVEKSKSYYVLNLSDSLINDLDGMHFGLLSFKMPSKVLVPGDYQLLVWKEGSKDTLKVDFETYWVNMPLSLNTADYAIDRMYYILTDAEYDQMKKGSETEKFAKIIKWWSKQDPTPETPFNESMEEYFRRADYAFFNFQTAMQKDGSLSDRGKIYILNGAPDTITDNPKSANSQEIWTFNRIGKQFTFEVISAGIYRLIDIKELSGK